TRGRCSIIRAGTSTGWSKRARIVRGEVYRLITEEYVKATKSLGAKTTRIMWKHLIPNMLGPIIVTLTLTIPNAIFTEAFLNFLGLGVPQPQASRGTMT